MKKKSIVVLCLVLLLGAVGVFGGIKVSKRNSAIKAQQNKTDKAVVEKTTAAEISDEQPVNNYIKDNSTEILVDAPEVSKGDIQKVVKHGDHWHVFTKGGKEIITYNDPTKLKDTSELKNQVKVVEKKDIDGGKIVSVRKHGDHWHVKTSDGKEYVMHEDPTGKDNISQMIKKNDTKIENPDNSGKSEKPSEKDNTPKITKIVKHGDHYHVVIDGIEYIKSEKEIEELKKNNKKLPPIEEHKNHHEEPHSEKLHFHGVQEHYHPNDITAIEAHSENKNIAGFRWLIKRAGAKEFSEISGQTTKLLKLKLTVKENNAEIKAEALDKNGKVLESCSKKIEVVDHGAHHHEEPHSEKLHFHGVQEHYHPNDITAIEAHSENKNITGFRWLIKRVGAKEFSVISGQTTKLLKLKLTVKENNAEIKAEALDKNGKVLESCSKKIEVVDHGAHHHEEAEEPYVNMHFHGDSEYSVGDALQLYAHSTASGIVKYKWLIKMAGASEFLTLDGEHSQTLEIKNLSLSYNGAVIKAQAIDGKDKVLDHSTLKLTVSEKIDTSSKAGEDILIKNLKVNPEIVERLKDKDSCITAGNVEFPYDAKNLEAVLKFLNRVIYLDLSGIKNVETDPVLKRLNNIQGFSFDENIDDEKLNTLFESNKNFYETLGYLSFSKSPITNLNFIEKIKDFNQLELDGIASSAIDFSKVSDGKLLNIWKLYIINSDVKSVSFLERMPNMEKLNISNTLVKDITAVGTLKNLRIFTFKNNRIDDLSALKGCKFLTTLVLDGTKNTKNKQVDLSFVNETNIKELLMKGCAISDLTALNGNEKILQLEASDSYSLMANKLPTLPNLKALNLTATYITSLADLPVYEKLEQLEIRQAGLENLDGIQKQKSLKIASFIGCMIKTFEISSPAPNIQMLILTENQLNSWDGFKKNFPNAQVVVSKNPISGTTP